MRVCDYSREAQNVLVLSFDFLFSSIFYVNFKIKTEKFFIAKQKISNFSHFSQTFRKKSQIFSKISIFPYGHWKFSFYLDIIKH
jgi:hypothetical protein